MTRADAEILTIDDLAELFTCDKETAAARLTSGDLPGVKVGRGWIIPRQALFERLNEKAREEAAIRREKCAASLEEAQRLGKAARAASSVLFSPPAAAELQTKGFTRSGRKRRVPPPLPKL
jgi:hypothetical protein